MAHVPAKTASAAVGYIRMSSDLQEKSPHQQREHILKLAARLGCRIIRWYQDLGVSGDNIKRRTDFRQMVADATAKMDFKLILCWSQDRFGRFDALDAGEWVAPLRRAGVRLVTVAEGEINWSDTAGRLIYTIQQEGKNTFLLDLARTSTRGRCQAAARVGFFGGPVPYGYDRIVYDERGVLQRRLNRSEKFHKPREWHNSPANVISKRPYSGINPILLDLVAMVRGYTSRFWATYRQWASLGAQVKKRPADVKHWGTQIVLYKQIKRTKIEDGEEKTETFPILRFFTVFNIEQVEGEGVDHLRASLAASKSQFDADFGPATAAIAATGADIRYGGNQAFYLPSEDYIQMPTVHQFDAFGDYFCTAFHELAHWSESRLGWRGTYAMGELIAEISSCYTAAELHIPGGVDLSNHTAYVQGWLQAMEDDPKAILKAASQASKATNFILSFSRKEQPQPEELQTV